MTPEEFLLADLAGHEFVFSWDWQADLRFARFLGETKIVESIEAAMASHAPWPNLFDFYQTIVKPVTQRRLRVLRSLVKAGKAEAEWVSSGECGRANYGVTRFRAYRLSGPTP
jgi:hypothetical protein